MELETVVYITAGVLSAAVLVLLITLCVLCAQLSSVKRDLHELQNSTRLRVQKLKIEPDKNHAFHNPSLVPDEELSRRGYTMYRADDDVESARGTERQTGGQFVEELSRELDSRQRQSAPPFLLQAIEENKRRSQSRPNNNPLVGGRGRASDTNPNFIY